jgi:hypothetical protein
MKRLTIGLCTVLSLLVSGGDAWAGSWGYGGYQPWWNVFAHRNKCLTPEEERLQRFWHDYYDALGRYYKALDHIDWVAYYKNHGYMINGGGGCGGGCGGCCGGPQRIQFAPVFVSPAMQWAMPAAAMPGPPPCGPGGMMPAGYPGPMYGMGMHQ